MADCFSMRTMSLDSAYRPTEEHDLLRESVRALAEEKIAPLAAQTDETGEFPWQVYRDLVASDMHAVHIPEEYGGVGADALATVIVIEEVARACTASSLIPAVNKLGTVPLLLSGSEELKQRYLRPCADGTAMFSYGLSEPEAGSDAAAMRTTAVKDGGCWVLNGSKMFITHGTSAHTLVIMAVTDKAKGPKGISSFIVERGMGGLLAGKYLATKLKAGDTLKIGSIKIEIRGTLERRPVSLEGTFVLRTGKAPFGTVRRARFTGTVTYAAGGAIDCGATSSGCEADAWLTAASGRRFLSANPGRRTLTLSFLDGAWYHVLERTGVAVSGGLPAIRVAASGLGSVAFSAGQTTETISGGCRQTTTEGTLTGALTHRFAGWGVRTFRAATAQYRQYSPV